MNKTQEAGQGVRRKEERLKEEKGVGAVSEFRLDTGLLGVRY